jgi:hypothetical protein
MSEPNLSALFSSLEQALKTKTVNNTFKISELTMAQQREILVTAFDQYEMPAKLSNAFNRIIQSNVEILIPEQRLTVLNKPILLRELRDLSIGDTFTRKNETEVETYKFNKIDYKKLDKAKTEQVITIADGIKIYLEIPTLDKDTLYNNHVLKAIAAQRRQNDQIDRGQITTIYLNFEILKYISKITVNDVDYPMVNLTLNEQLRAVSSFPQDTSDKITKFIENVRNVEEMVFKAANVKTKEEISVDPQLNLFSKEL